MFACSGYPDEQESFLDAARSECETAVRLYRHHPAIALWSANNECYGASGGSFSRSSRIYAGNWIRTGLFGPGAPPAAASPATPTTGTAPFMTPGAIAPEFRVRFVSEYGVLGPCHLDSIREYLGPVEPTRGDANWKLHTQEWERASEFVSKGIRLNYADPEQLTLPEWVEYGQMWQAIIQGGMMEALRFQKNDPKNDCEGALIWSYTDTVGETGWAILDYYMRRKAAYYWFRRAAAPVKVIVRERGGRCITRLVNDTLDPVSGTVELGWWRLDGSAKVIESRPVSIGANQMLEVASVDGQEHADRKEWLYAAVLRDGHGQPVDQSVWLPAPLRELKLAAPEIKVTRSDDGWLEVSSPAFAHAVHTEDHGHELISDNWFDLLPGVPVRLRVPARANAETLHFEALRPR